MRTMRREEAKRLLGKDNAGIARELGITRQAVGKWPDPLPEETALRVQAALARRKLPPEEIGSYAPADDGSCVAEDSSADAD